MLLDMTATHVPVLAGELIELLDPQPGETAIDCTFGGGGHARLIAERIGPERHADRDRPRPGGRGALRRAGGRGAVRRRASSARRSPTASRELRDEGVRADLVYLDLGMSSMQVDTRERGFSYAYDAPLDMRMDPDQELTAAEVVNEWDERRLARAAARVRRGALRRPDRPRDRPRAAREARSRRRSELVESISRRDPRARALRRRPSGQAHLPGDPHRGQRRARAARRGAAARVGRPARATGRFAGISFHSLEDRRVKRFLADRATGCVCPPDLPVCVCGREPEAELLTRRARRRRRPGEVAANPRSRSRRACAPHASSARWTHDPARRTAAGRTQTRRPARKAAAPKGRRPASRAGASGGRARQADRRRSAAPRAPPGLRTRRRPRRGGGSGAPPSGARAARARCVASRPTLPDRRSLDRLVRGRAWIGVLGDPAHRASSSCRCRCSSSTPGSAARWSAARRSTRQNGELRAQVSQLESGERIQERAAALGMILPPAGQSATSARGAATTPVRAASALGERRFNDPAKANALPGSEDPPDPLTTALTAGATPPRARTSRATTDEPTARRRRTRRTRRLHRLHRYDRRRSTGSTAGPRVDDAAGPATPRRRGDGRRHRRRGRRHRRHRRRPPRASRGRGAMGPLDRRIGLLFAVFLGLLAFAALRAAYARRRSRRPALQSAANTQQVATVTVPARRGAITDRHGSSSPSPSRPTTSRPARTSSRIPPGWPSGSRRCSRPAEDGC